VKPAPSERELATLRALEAQWAAQGEARRVAALQAERDEAERKRAQAEQEKAEAELSRREGRGPPLKYEVVSCERMSKGASANSTSPLRYIVFSVRAVLAEDSGKMNKESLASTLHTILDDTKAKAAKESTAIDGISALLYHSRQHWEAADVPLGSADWWPNGHSFANDNYANIADKESYETTVKVWRVPQDAEVTGSRLEKSKRQEVFMALVRSEDRATREAKANTPIDEGVFRRAPDTYRQHVIDVTAKRYGEEKALRIKYREELLRAYELSEDELKAIQKEALAENWPMPRAE
jgi:hypothetical protein